MRSAIASPELSPTSLAYSYRLRIALVVTLLIATVAVAILILGGSEESAVAVRTSPVGSWEVAELTNDGEEVEVDPGIAIEIVDESVTGGSGCQGFSADILWDDAGAVSISESYVVTLRPGCPQDDPLLRAFFDAEMWSVSGAGDLVFNGPTTLLTLAPTGPDS